MAQDRAPEDIDSVSNVIPLFPCLTASVTSERQRLGGIPRVRQPLTSPLFTRSALDTATVPPSASIIDPAEIAIMMVNIVRQWRTRQEFASGMSTESEIIPVINGMRAYFADQGRRLVAIRMACTGLSATEFAAEIGIGKSYLSELENNKKDISLEVAKTIKSRWRLPLDFIIDGDIEMLDQAPARIVRKLEELAAA